MLCDLLRGAIALRLLGSTSIDGNSPFVSRGVRSIGALVVLDVTVEEGETTG